MVHIEETLQIWNINNIFVSFQLHLFCYNCTLYRTFASSKLLFCDIHSLNLHFFFIFFQCRSHCNNWGNFYVGHNQATLNKFQNYMLYSLSSHLDPNELLWNLKPLNHVLATLLLASFSTFVFSLHHLNRNKIMDYFIIHNKKKEK